MCGAQAAGRQDRAESGGFGASSKSGSRAEPGLPRAARPAHLVLLVIANAPHQVLQVLVEHAVDAALDHLEGHRGGRRQAAAPGGPRPDAARGSGGRACCPWSAALPAAAAGQAPRPGWRRSVGRQRRPRRLDALGRPRSPPLTLRGTCKWRTRWRPVS